MPIESITEKARRSVTHRGSPYRDQPSDIASSTLTASHTHHYSDRRHNHSDLYLTQDHDGFPSHSGTEFVSNDHEVLSVDQYDDDDDDQLRREYRAQVAAGLAEMDFSGVDDDEITSTANTDPKRKWYCYAIILMSIVLVGTIIGTGVMASEKKKANNASAVGTGFAGYDPSYTNGGTQAPTTELYTIVRARSPTNGREFRAPDSYQTRALAWLEQTSDSSIHSLDRILQRYALACIYYATNGVPTQWTAFELGQDSGDDVMPWLDSTGWLTATNECDWAGVICDDATSDDPRVVELDLSDNILTGRFPVETIYLKDTLRTLDLYNNLVYNVDGPGNDWLGELTQLTSLYLGSTSFQNDGIPAAIGQLTNLVELDVSYTLYFGALRDDVFERLDNLRYLWMGGNSYNSTIPRAVGQLPSLLYLYAEYTDLEGSLETWLNSESQIPGMFELWIDQNPKMSGTIPTMMGTLTDLASLSMTQCSLEGTLPTELGQLTDMQQMWFYSNALTGDIPTELSNLVRMNRFEAFDNQLGKLGC